VGIICRSPVWEFGVIDQTKTQTLTHTFRLDNLTKSTVQIDKIRTTCGCVAPEDDAPTEIPAGASANVKLVVRTAGRPGPFRKFAYVDLDTSPSARIQLVIRGMLTSSPALYLVPKALDFGTLDGNETQSRTVKISRYNGSPVGSVLAHPESNSISQAAAVSGDDDDSFVDLTFSLNSSLLEAGDFSSKVVVSAQDGSPSTVVLPIRARIGGEHSGLVRTVFARLAPGGFRDVPLSDGTGRVPEIESVAVAGSDAVTVALLENQGNSEAPGSPVLRVSRSDDRSDARVVRGQLLIKLASPRRSAVVPLCVMLSD
jgi:hypothetical protein